MGFNCYAPRSLYEKGLSKQEIIDIFIFIDWLMVLPGALVQAFNEKVLKFEEENKMSHVSSIERLGQEKGRARGRIDGAIPSYQKLLSKEQSSNEELRHYSNS